MCPNVNEHSKDKKKCIIISAVSLITNTLLICILIARLIMITWNAKTGHGIYHLYWNLDMQGNTLSIFVGTLLAFFSFSAIAAVILLIGIKYNKPGCVATYLFFNVLTNILLLVGGLLLMLNVYRRVSITMFCLCVLNFYLSRIVYRTYEDMMKEAAIINQNRISDITLLIDDLSDDSRGPAY